jgi:hypothetical protein
MMMPIVPEGSKTIVITGNSKAYYRSYSMGFRLICEEVEPYHHFSLDRLAAFTREGLKLTRGLQKIRGVTVVAARPFKIKLARARGFSWLDREKLILEEFIDLFEDPYDIEFKRRGH